MSAPLVANLVATGSFGYLLGTFPTAALVARRHGIDDLRAVGDRNPGFWNAMDQLGWRPALPILAGDIAKGTIAALAGAIMLDRWWAPFVTGGAAMVGHAIPVWSRGRGGRSVATFVGVAPVIAPVAAAAATFGIAAPVWALTRRLDRGVRAGVAAFPIIQLVTDGPARTAATGALMTFVGARFGLAALSERRRAAACAI